jgi:hypothetical protein
MGHIYFFDSPSATVFFHEKTQKKSVICEIFMCEATSQQAKGMILPHHSMKINHWLRGITWPYLFFWFTMCKGLLSWENVEKKGNLWNFDAWSHILTGKRHHTATTLHENQPLTQVRGINWPYLCFWFTMWKGLFSWEDTGKIGKLWNFDVWSPILTGKRHDTEVFAAMPGFQKWDYRAPSAESTCENKPFGCWWLLGTFSFENRNGR